MFRWTRSTRSNSSHFNNLESPDYAMYFSSNLVSEDIFHSLVLLQQTIALALRLDFSNNLILRHKTEIKIESVHTSLTNLEENFSMKE
jgi:hypothetical protein